MDTEMNIVQPVDTSLPVDDMTNIIPEPTGIDQPVPLDVVDGVQDTSNTTIGQFFGTLQESITIVWRFHLQTNKHYYHVILNDFYNDAIDLVDAIIEHYQGQNGIVEDYINTILGENKSEIDYLKELRNFTIDSRQKLFNTEWTELWSDVDDFIGLIDSTLYKLTAFTENKIKTFEQFCFEDYEGGIEGGADGVFDKVTKTLSTNVTKDSAKTKCTNCECCDDDDDDEEEE